jgi:pantoate--beta-alanine ligase
MIGPVDDRSSLARTLSDWRRMGLRIGLVPTMGNLHAGHFALLTQARGSADRVVASVFVNPTQFGAGEDYERYPRTLADDAAGLAAHGCDLLFAPSPAAIYPFGADAGSRVTVPALADVLCGAHRPGHFDGVATVVARLFALVRPDCAVFGEKDFQQLRIIERMNEDVGFGVAILRGTTVRDADGLALSSRNRYLNNAQRRTAARLHAVLSEVAGCWRGAEEGDAVLTAARDTLVAEGFALDYLEARCETDLSVASRTDRDPVRIFVAARLGGTRLIDNLRIR